LVATSDGLCTAIRGASIPVDIEYRPPCSPMQSVRNGRCWARPPGSSGRPDASSTTTARTPAVVGWNTSMRHRGPNYSSPRSTHTCRRSVTS